MNAKQVERLTNLERYPIDEIDGEHCTELMVRPVSSECGLGAPTTKSS